MIKILYAGSPIASAAVLSKLIEKARTSQKFQIAGVLTNPPSTRGRHSDLIPTEVSQVARAYEIPVFEFDHLLEDARNAVKPLEADILVSFDYGRIFGPKFLGLFPLGGINLHPSALPSYRGCTPVPQAILNGDSELGITVQKLALETDSGDILKQVFVALDGTETTLSLMDGDLCADKSTGEVKGSSVITEKGAELLGEVLLDAADSGVLEGKPQSGEVTYTNFIKKEDGIIDWNRTSVEIDRQIRAYTPWPQCSTMFGQLKLTVIKARPAAYPENGAEAPDSSSVLPGTVLPYRKAVGIEIACGNGTVLVVTELQLQGKKAMDYKSFINGARDFAGTLLSGN